MGTIRKFSCPSCHKMWKIHIGHGLRHGALSRVLKEFPPDMQREILEDTQGDQAPLFDFNYRAAVCPQCRDLVGVPVIRLHETGRSFVSGCPVCGSPVTMPEEDSCLICPACRVGHLTSQDMGQWD